MKLLQLFGNLTRILMCLKLCWKRRSSPLPTYPNLLWYPNQDSCFFCTLLDLLHSYFTFVEEQLLSCKCLLWCMHACLSGHVAATENPFGSLLTDLPKPGGGTYGKYYSLPKLNDPRVGKLLNCYIEPSVLYKANIMVLWINDGSPFVRRSDLVWLLGS
jgi:hypothetical protein